MTFSFEFHIITLFIDCTHIYEACIWCQALISAWRCGHWLESFCLPLKTRSSAFSTLLCASGDCPVGAAGSFGTSREPQQAIWRMEERGWDIYFLSSLLKGDHELAVPLDCRSLLLLGGPLHIAFPFSGFQEGFYRALRPRSDSGTAPVQTEVTQQSLGK